MPVSLERRITAMRFSLGALLLLGFTAVLQAEEAAPDFEHKKHEVKLQSAELKETSGLAASCVDPNLLWALNDSGGTPELFLTDIKGANRGKVTVKGVENVDWEDLDSFVLDGKPYLLIADTGDNDSKRDNCWIHIVPEPAATAEGAMISGKVKVAWSIHFHYEDGPRDCEAVSVDAKAGKILLLSKRTPVPILYELPLKPEEKGKQVAKKIAVLPKAFPNTVPPYPYGSQPTGMSISADGSMAAVVTYAKLFVFARHGDEPWGAAFLREPVALHPHHLRQAESIAFSRDGKQLRVTSEGSNEPIVLYEKK